MAEARAMPNVTDERLCWLVVRDELRKKAGRLRVFGWITVLFSRNDGATTTGGDLRREYASDRMADYTLAVDDAAQGLSPEERRYLRAVGEVPEWFMADVERRYQVIRKQR
ncbi:hypothetical protein ABZ479_22260 [Streptomyces sp. NPDC005722]